MANTTKTGKGLRCDVCGRKAVFSWPAKKIRRCGSHIPQPSCAYCGDTITTETGTDRNGVVVYMWRDSFGLTSCPAREPYSMHRATVVE